MKVMAFNGSPKANGNTYASINAVAEELKKEGIDVEIINVGNKNITGCKACGGCSKTGKCVINDGVNEMIEKMKDADGVILGTPVYYAGLNGTMKAFLDRAFMLVGANGAFLRHKVGVSVAVARRAGTIQAVDEMNKFLSFYEMVIPTANYWDVVFGGAPGDALKDEEGMQIMRVLGKNMAWVLKLIENGKATVKEPEREVKIKTNYID